MVDWSMLSAVSAATIATGTVIGTAVKTSWYLRDKFIELQKSTHDLLDDHEVKDQSRHNDNLTRFVAVEAKAQLRHEDNIQRLATIEAQLGIIIRNGNSAPHPT